MNYQIPKTPFFIHVTRNGYEVHEVTGEKEDGTQISKFIWYFKGLDNCFDSIVQLLLSRQNNTKNVKHSIEDIEKVIEFVKKLKVAYKQRIIKAMKELNNG